MNLRSANHAEVATLIKKVSGRRQSAVRPDESANARLVAICLAGNQVDHGGERVGAVENRSGTANDFNALQDFDWEGLQQIGNNSALHYFPGRAAIDKEQNVGTGSFGLITVGGNQGAIGEVLAGLSQTGYAIQHFAECEPAETAHLVAGDHRHN